MDIYLVKAVVAGVGFGFVIPASNKAMYGGYNLRYLVLTVALAIGSSVLFYYGVQKQVPPMRANTLSFLMLMIQAVIILGCYFYVTPTFTARQGLGLLLAMLGIVGMWLMFSPQPQQ